MDEKKMTRRVVIGSAIGAVIVSPIVIRALRNDFEVDIPEGTRPMTMGGKIVTEYKGVEIELEIPEIVVAVPEDEEKFKELVMEALKKSPQYAEQNRKELRDVQAQGRQQILDEYAKMERNIRQGIANSKTMNESERTALLAKSLKDLQAGKEAGLKQIDDLALPANP